MRGHMPSGSNACCRFAFFDPLSAPWAVGWMYQAGQVVPAIFSRFVPVKIASSGTGSYEVCNLQKKNLNDVKRTAKIDDQNNEETWVLIGQSLCVGGGGPRTYKRTGNFGVYNCATTGYMYRLGNKSP